MFHVEQFREVLVRPTLELINMWSPAAEELMVMTCAHESLGGTYLQQVKGPALGIYMMEPETHDDVWNVVLQKRIDVLYKVLEAARLQYKPSAELLTANLQYATLLARIQYSRFKEPLPASHDVFGLAEYYKRFWNTSEGKASISEVVSNYNKFTGKKPPAAKKPAKKKAVASKTSV
jgi:thiamine biosynthesis lipoprotein ApbE